MAVLDPEIEAKYEVLAKMGEGGMGSVYKVRHRWLRDIRVIKTGKFEDDNQAERDRFRSEAQRGYDLRHDNIAKVTDFDITTNGTAYIVMEFIDGKSLLQELGQPKRPLHPLRVIDIAMQTLDALQYLHERGVVHRDISPQNIMLTSDKSGKPLVKLIDLGIAKSLEASENFTATGMFVGKFKYASPEQFRGDAKGPSDLYSLGIVMFELLTGVLPLRSTDKFAVYAAHITGDLRSFDEVDAEGQVPESLRAVVMRALKMDPKDRFQTATSFAEALRPLSSASVLEKTAKVKISSLETETLPALLEIPTEAGGDSAARSPDQIAFDSAFVSDSPEAWDDFLARYPASPWSDSARARSNEIDRKDWDEAAKANTLDAWNAYLEKHPDSPRVSSAQSLRKKVEGEEAERRAWDAALVSGTTTAYELFIRRHPDGSHVEEARGRLAERAWAAAKGADGSDGWQSFIDRYPDSRHLEEAKRNLATALYREKEIRDWEAAAEAGSIESWQSYLDLYSDSARRGEAEERLAVLHQEAAERSAWSTAKAANTSKGWSGYLQRFPQSPRAAEAERELSNAEEREKEQLDWEVAAAVDTTHGWQAYLTKHPDGRAGMAQRRLAAADEAEAWTAAENNGSSAAWQQFLGQFGASNRTAKAKELLAAAEKKESSERYFEAATALDTVKAWNDFLSRHGDTDLAPDAHRRLEHAKRKETEQQAFAEAKRIDSVEIWTDFINRHRESARLDAAREALAQARKSVEAIQAEEEASAAWSRAEALRTIKGWEEYLANWSSSKRAVEASARLEEAYAAARNEAVKDGTIPALERFLEMYPRSSYAPEVRERLKQVLAKENRRIQEDRKRALAEAARKEEEDREWSATKGGSIAALEMFIGNHPQSPHAAEAKNLIETIHQREREAVLAAEEKAWRAAVKRDSIQGYEAFITAHSESGHASEAPKKIGEIRAREAAAEEERAWSAAAKSNTILGYEKFIQAYPQSKRLANARDRIERMKTAAAEEAAAVVERSWSAAININSAVQYEKFIRSYPEAKQVDEARRRITEKENAAAAAIRAKEAAARTRAAKEAAAKALAKEQAAAKALEKEQAANRARAEREAAARARAEKEAARQATSISEATPPAQRSRAAVWLSAAAVAAALTAGVYYLPAKYWPAGKPPVEPKPAPISQTTTETPLPVPTTTSAPSVPAGAGGLLINAFPWGEVTSVKDNATKTERVLSGQPLYTPANLTLPPGSYTVVLSNPNSKTPQLCSVTVIEGKTVKCEKVIDTLDSNDYLRALTPSGQ